MVLTKNFNLNEFKCKCGCNENKINHDLVIRLQLARDISKIPYIITSGYRCEKHNKNIGGVKNSTHILGLASDIKFKNNHELFLIVKGLIMVGFLRILIYPKRKFIHVDIANDRVNKIIKIME